MKTFGTVFSATQDRLVFLVGLRKTWFNGESLRKTWLVFGGFNNANAVIDSLVIALPFGFSTCKKLFNVLFFHLMRCRGAGGSVTKRF